MGDFAPPPPVYESPSDRRRALTESARVTRRGGKEGVPGVRPEYVAILPPSRPIKPQTQETRSRVRQPRRHYEIWWEREAELPALISAAWQEAGQKGDLGSVRRSLEEVMIVLQNWSKKKFGNVLKELDKCRKQLEELMWLNNDREAIRKVSGQMNELLYKEEMLWLQRSRVN
nr:uncharacterized protein LOC127316565 [Lolium perenne]